MNWNKILIGTLIGAVAYFFLGWLVYGILLKPMFTYPAGYMESWAYSDAEMKMGYMTLSCFLWGLFLAYVLYRMGVNSLQDGAFTAVFVSVIVSLCFNAGFISMYKWASTNSLLWDVVGNIICNVICGGLIGWWYGRK